MKSTRILLNQLYDALVDAISANIDAVTIASDCPPLKFINNVVSDEFNTEMFKNAITTANNMGYTVNFVSPQKMSAIHRKFRDSVKYAHGNVIFPKREINILKTLTDNQKLLILLHEMLHIISFCHMPEDENLDVYNKDMQEVIVDFAAVLIAVLHEIKPYYALSSLASHLWHYCADKYNTPKVCAEVAEMELVKCKSYVCDIAARLLVLILARKGGGQIKEQVLRQV